jgi:DNA-binding HxlR family transcriptional regulator
MLTKEELPACPVATTVNLIGNKWKILILRDLLTGTKRFGELRKSVSGISQKVLTDNLRSLEDDGIVIRNIFAEIPPRVEYSLSELGETLRPIIDVMAEWGTSYKARFEKPKMKSMK